MEVGERHHSGLRARRTGPYLDCTFRDCLTLEKEVFREFSGIFPILAGVSGLQKQPLLPD